MAFTNRQGFGVSSRHVLSIASGETDSGVADLGRVYAWVVLRIVDTTGLQASTTLTINVGMQTEDTLVALDDDNLPLAADALIQKTIFVNARRIQVILDTVTDDDATIEVYGIDASENSANA